MRPATRRCCLNPHPPRRITPSPCSSIRNQPCAPLLSPSASQTDNLSWQVSSYLPKRLLSRYVGDVGARGELDRWWRFSKRWRAVFVLPTFDWNIFTYTILLYYILYYYTILLYYIIILLYLLYLFYFLDIYILLIYYTIFIFYLFTIFTIYFTSPGLDEARLSQSRVNFSLTSTSDTRRWLKVILNNDFQLGFLC